jgi:AraC-like DNA-binding protein
MSPLQFQKQLRLHHARQLLISEALDAATAGHRVGYESPSQFSREYSRLFGAPPAADRKRLASAGEVI